MNQIQVSAEQPKPNTSNMITISTRPSLPTEHEMMLLKNVAEQAFASKMYPNIKDKSGFMMLILSAKELGIPVCQALNGGLNIIQGKVEISARMMSALIRKAGHKISVKECTPIHCVLVGKRNDTGEVQSASFSVAEAQLAGLVKPGSGWIKWPKDMCFARALSRLARQLFSDVIGMGYVEGEISQDTEIKPSEYEEIISEETFEFEEVMVENEQEYIDKLLNFFDKEDRYYAMEYLKVVQEHYNWTTIQTVKELLKDEEKLLSKFNSWKNKINKAKEI